MNLDDKSLQRFSKKRVMSWPYQTQTPALVEKVKKVTFWCAVTFSLFTTFLISVGILGETLPVWVYLITGMVTFFTATMAFQSFKVPLPHFEYLNIATSLWEATHIPHISEKLPSLLKDDAAQQLKHLRTAFHATEKEKRVGGVTLNTQRDAETVLVSVKEFLKYLETAYYVTLNDEHSFKNEPCERPKTSHTVTYLVNELSKKLLQLKQHTNTSWEVDSLSYYATLSQNITDDAKSVIETWTASLNGTNPHVLMGNSEKVNTLTLLKNNPFLKLLLNNSLPPRK